MKVSIDLQPFRVPNFVIAMMPPRERQEGMQEAPKFALKDLDAATLYQLCVEFRKNVFAKAEQTDPLEAR